MTGNEKYLVMIFPATSYALKAEKILKVENIAYKLIPIPRHIDSDCGICLRFTKEAKEKIVAALAGRVKYDVIREL